MIHPTNKWTEFPNFAHEGNFIIIASITTTSLMSNTTIFISIWIVNATPFSLQFHRYVQFMSLATLTKDWIRKEERAMPKQRKRITLTSTWYAIMYIGIIESLQKYSLSNGAINRNILNIAILKVNFRLLIYNYIGVCL